MVANRKEENLFRRYSFFFSLIGTYTNHENCFYDFRNFFSIIFSLQLIYEK